MNDSVGPEDVRAAAVCREALFGVVDRDWSILAGGLEWSCRRTHEHIESAPIEYASELALPAQESLEGSYPSGGMDQLTVPDLLLLLEVNAAILGHVLRAAPAAARAFHRAWVDQADLPGWGATKS